MADVLMPALVESFARSQQLQVTLDQIDDSHFVQTLQRAGALQPAGRFSFRTTNTDEGFADLIANETDIVMSVREVRRSEVRLGAEVGLGQTARRSAAKSHRRVGCASPSCGCCCICFSDFPC